MKVQCFPKKKNPYAWKNERSLEVPLRKVVPFFMSGQGAYTHRIRAGTAYFWDGIFTHSSLQLWCGMTGLIGKRHHHSFMIQHLDKGSIMCATCEGRAIGSGQLGSHEIQGRFVKFQPRGF